MNPRREQTDLAGSACAWESEAETKAGLGLERGKEQGGRQG